MYIECKTFNQWLIKANSNSISPGGMARDFRVSRQTVNNWINDDVIDAYSYSGQEGSFTIIQKSQYTKALNYRKKHGKI